MANPIAKNKKTIKAGETTFEFATTIRGEPLLEHDVRLTDPQGNSIDVPARDIFQFTAEALVAPCKRLALETAVEEMDFPSILLGKI